MSTYSRRNILLGAAAAAAGGLLYARKRVRDALAARTRLASFSATPPPPVHDPVRDRTRLFVAQGGSPAANIDAVWDKAQLAITADAVVIIKVSAQWWNQGMTNVGAVRRVVERVLATPNFSGEVIVFENVHFRLPDGSGLARAWTQPSERNVDVDGWNKMGDLIPHFAKLGAPVSFVGLVDGGKNDLADDPWHDSTHEHGVYGGDGRGPIAAGDARDGYHWDFDNVFRLRRSLFDYAQTPLTWPRFSSPRTGVVVDLRDGLFARKNNTLVPLPQKLVFLNMTTCNEHASTGFTGACKSAMGIVDMSAGRLGSDPRVAQFRAVHYFGHPDATWRMAGPLALFGERVRKPDLYLTVAQWISVTPKGVPWDPEGKDTRLAAESAVQTRTVVAGTDPVAIDTWCVRNLLMAHAGARTDLYHLDGYSKVVKFLRYFRHVAGRGALDLSLVDVV